MLFVTKQKILNTINGNVFTILFNYYEKIFQYVYTDRLHAYIITTFHVTCAHCITGPACAAISCVLSMIIKPLIKAITHAGVSKNSITFSFFLLLPKDINTSFN